MEHIYSNKGSSSGNNKNEDKAATLTTVSQQRAETVNIRTPAPLSSDQAGLHLYYVIIVILITYECVKYFKTPHFGKSFAKIYHFL